MRRKINSANDASEPQVLISRIFDAPPELVFIAWINREHLKNWYAPHGCTVDFSTIDVRPGGTFHYCIKNPKHHDCWCIGVYQEIVVPYRIVYSLAIADKKGNRIQPSEIGMDPEWPAETVVTVTFEAYQGKTKVTLHQTVCEYIAKRTGAYPSWLEMLDRLNKLMVTAVAQL